MNLLYPLTGLLLLGIGLDFTLCGILLFFYRDLSKLPRFFGFWIAKRILNTRIKPTNKYSKFYFSVDFWIINFIFSGFLIIIASILMIIDFISSFH